MQARPLRFWCGLCKTLGKQTDKTNQPSFRESILASNPPAPPAPVDPRDDAFMREVDDAYRADETHKLIRRYGRWVVLGLAVGLAALGGFLFWQAEQAKKAEALSERFTLALDKIDAADSVGAMKEMTDIASTGNPTYRALARIAQAGIIASGGDVDAAAKQLQAVAADAEAPRVLRDSATLKELRLKYDTLEPAEILKRTAPFVDGDSAWFPVAAEMAALAHLKLGQPDKAGPLFLRIAMERSAPQSLRSRAEQMAAALGQDVSKIAEAEARAAESAAKASGTDKAAAAAAGEDSK